jgi:hypothetical protein
MAHGMVQRYQGKIGVNTVWLGSLTNTNGGIFLRYNGAQISPRDLAGLAGRSATSTDPVDATGSTIGNSGITALSSSSGTRSLATPAQGIVKEFYADQASTGGLRKIYSGSSLITFDGTNDVMTSSAAGAISLLGLSTTRWLIQANTGSASLGTTT